MYLIYSGQNHIPVIADSLTYTNCHNNEDHSGRLELGPVLELVDIWQSHTGWEEWKHRLQMCQ